MTRCSIPQDTVYLRLLAMEAERRRSHYCLYCRCIGYPLFTLTVTSWEQSALALGPWYLLLLAGGLLVVWELLSRFRKDEFDPTDLGFEDRQAPAIELLNLTGRLPYD